MTASSGNPSSASSATLAAGELHLRVCHVDAAAALDTSVLSPDERDRARQRASGGDPVFAHGRALLRHLLSGYAGVRPDALQFAIGPHGKPGLVAPRSGLEFNLSHSGEWLAFAFARGVAVGVDVQIIDPERRVGRLARRYFSAPEVAELEALAGDARLTRFYQLWALKEAWTKAHGESLPGALGSTTFSLRDGELHRSGSAGGSLALLDLAGYSLAVCGLGSNLLLRAARWPGSMEEAAAEPCVTASAGFL